MVRKGGMGSHYRETFRLGLPLVLGQIGQVVIGFVDSAMVGSHSLSGLAAASFCVNLFNLPLIFLLGYSYGLTPLVGQCVGRGDARSAGAVFRLGLRLNALLGLLVSLVMGVGYFFLDCLGQPAELLSQIRGYYLLQLGSLLFVSVFNAFKQCTDALGRTSVSMWLMIVGNAVNVVGNWVLIFGHWGAPELGLLGAGVATLLSRIVVVLLYGVVFFGKRFFRRYLVGYFRQALPAHEWRLMVRTGGYIALQMALETALFSLSVVMVGWLGELPLAAHHIAVTIQTLGFMVYYGVGAAVSIRISHFWGKGDVAMVRQATRGGLHVIMLFALLMGGLMISLRSPLAHLFTDSSEVIGLATCLLLVGIAYQPADALQVLYANALRGVGDSQGLALVSLVGYIAVGLPLGYLFAFTFGWGVVGVWLSFPIGLALAAGGYAVRFRRVARANREALAL